MPQTFHPPVGRPKERQIKRLCDKTGCSRETSIQALLEHQGSLLSAFLALESQGVVSGPDLPHGGVFSTKDKHFVVETPAIPEDEPEHSWSWPLLWGHFKHEIWNNNFELWHHGVMMGKLRVPLLLLLFPLTYGSLLLLLTIPLFFGVYYRFSSQGSFLSEFNPIVKRMSTFFHKVRHMFKKTPKQD